MQEIESLKKELSELADGIYQIHESYSRIKRIYEELRWRVENGSK